MRDEKILEVKNLTVHLKGKKGQYKEIIKDISFDLFAGECIGILGESGSGKSITVKSILGLLEDNFVIEGTAFYKGRDLLKESGETLRSIRGREVAMILQNPMTCFDPLYRVGTQINETWLAHKNISKEQMQKEAMELLEKMQIFNGEEVLCKYPHQLSGGMLQRITIGLALSMEPAILVADEPTTAIDAITQYEIMKEFIKIKDSGKTSMIFITHDLSVISKIAHRIIVMNKGKIVDEGNFLHITTAAKDAYTKQLVKSKQMTTLRYNQILHSGGAHD